MKINKVEIKNTGNGIVGEFKAGKSDGQWFRIYGEDMVEFAAEMRTAIIKYDVEFGAGIGIYIKESGHIIERTTDGICQYMQDKAENMMMGSGYK